MVFGSFLRPSPFKIQLILFSGARTRNTEIKKRFVNEIRKKVLYFLSDSFSFWLVQKVSIVRIVEPGHEKIFFF